MDRRFSGPGGSWAGGPSERQKNYASNLQEQDSFISSYEHLTGMPDPPEALMRLRKIASLVKPIMRKRGWHVTTLTEFLPEDSRLLGLNINHGHKICIRLRYSHRPASFLPIEQCVDTMLHELSHIIFGPHDAKFHALWDELRNEHETLLMKGYTGEGFLTKGHKLGGSYMPPNTELRRLARQNAEKNRKSLESDKKLRGFKLGGRRILPGQDPRKVIADAIERRNTINQGCASGSKDADSLARQPSQRTTKTKSGDNDANDRAIAEALLELMEEEEMRKLDGPGFSEGLSWTAENGLSLEPPDRPIRSNSSSALGGMTEEDQIKWALQESMKTIPSTNNGTRQRSHSPMPAPTARSLPRAGSAPLPDHSMEDSNKASKRPRPFTPEVDMDPPNTMSGGLGAPSLTSMPTSSYARDQKPGLSDLAGALGAAAAPTWKEGVNRIQRKPTPPSAPTLNSVRNPRNNTTSTSTARLPPIMTKPTPSATGSDNSLPSPPDSNPPDAMDHDHYDPTSAPDDDDRPVTWTCEICTCMNPLQYLACDACGLERSPSTTASLTREQQTRRLTDSSRSRGTGAGGSSSSNRRADKGKALDRTAAANLERVGRQGAVLQRPESSGWACRRCATFMEHRYWTCSVCGLMKGDSRANEHVLL